MGNSNGYTRIFNQRHGGPEDEMLRTLKMSSDETLNIFTPSAEKLCTYFYREERGKVSERGGRVAERKIYEVDICLVTDMVLKRCLPAGGRRAGEVKEKWESKGGSFGTNSSKLCSRNLFSAIY